MLVSEGQDDTTFDPGQLEIGRTYYWRIDEVEADGAVKTGKVWQFTTEPLAYPLRSVTAAASSSDADREPQNTVNGSGLDSAGLRHDIMGGGTMWLSRSDDPGPVWIQYEFDRTYKLHEMRVWNYNAEGLNAMYGLKAVTVECSLDGNSFTPVGDFEIAKAPGMAGYASNTTAALTGVVARYIRIEARSNWSNGLLNQYGLSEVQFFHVPVRARDPHPAPGSTDVPVDATLSWRAGREAARHEVYLSTDEQTVANGTAPVKTVTSPSYGCSLDLASMYYWRVDEVNDLVIPAFLPGEVWSFRTQEFFVVDDFESYTDQPGQCVYETWIDRFVNGTGSTVGLYPDAIRGTFCDTTVFHGGKQSMPLHYDNSAAPFYSETQVTFATPRDWTGAGMQTLTLYFKGIPPAFVEAPAGVFAISSAGQDIWGTSDQGRLVYQQLSGDGSVVCRVDSVENTHEWARAGLMIRQRLDANSAHVYLMVAAGGHVEFAYRRTTDATTQGVAVNEIPTPHWVKLTRKADTFTAAHSADGVNWVPVGNDPAASSVTIALGQSVYAGLVYTSHAGVMGIARLSEVATTGSVSGTWQAADLGLEMGNGNDAAPLYVAVEDSSGRSKTVTRGDPAATQAASWQEWNIDLKELASAGVKLSGIKKMYLGVGNKAAPVAGGKGTLYIDDVRLGPTREP